MSKSQPKPCVPNPAQQSLFVQKAALVVAPEVLDEVRNAMAELLLEAVRLSRREAADERKDH